MENQRDCINTGALTVHAKECEPNTDATTLHPSWQINDVKTGSEWVKVRDYIGVPRPRDFKMTTVPIPNLGKREILVEVLCWSVENYIRDFDIKRGTIIMGETVASVVASRHKDFKPKMFVICAAGWRTHWVLNPDETPIRPMIDILDFPVSICLGPLGLPGLLAYFSFLNVCLPQPGNTVLVNAGAGSVGSVVGQLAKIKGCTVIAFASSRARCAWMRELGFDYVYNQSVAVSAALRRRSHREVNLYFDCVGAEFTKGVLQHMKADGTICMFGYNSSYARRAGLAAERLCDPYTLLYMRHGMVGSCSVFDFQDRFLEAQAELLEWMTQGKLRTRETMLEGFEHLPDALQAVYDDSSVGTVLVKSDTVESLTTNQLCQEGGNFQVER